MYQGALRLKFKKLHKAILIRKSKEKIESSLFIPKFADFAMQATSTGRLTNRHIETGRRHLRRSFKKRVSIKINMFPYHSFTQKPVSARMGKGKGRVYGWIFPCKKGRILYEMKFTRVVVFQLSRYRKIFVGLTKKLPVRVRFVRLIY
jgi:ribosomal protein L16